MTTTLFGAAEAQAARALVGGTAIGDVRNELLKQILVATANKTSGSGGVAWGTITGTLADQIDLNAALGTKMDRAGSAFTGLTGAGFRDTSAAFDVTLGFTSSVALDAGRALTIDMGNVAHTIALGTTAGTITFPSHAALTVAGLEIANVFTAAQTITGANNYIYLSGAGSYIQAGGASAAAFGSLAANHQFVFNGSSACKFSTANTYTSSTNFEAVEMGFTSNLAHLWTTKGSGGGTARDLALGRDSTEYMRFKTGGVINLSNVPSSSAGLAAGDVYHTAGALMIVT